MDFQMWGFGSVSESWVWGFQVSIQVLGSSSVPESWGSVGLGFQVCV